MKSIKQIIREEIDDYRGNIKTPREIAEHIYNLLTPEQQEENDWDFNEYYNTIKSFGKKYELIDINPNELKFNEDLNPDTVEDYEYLINNNSPIPEIVIDANNEIIDGNHRAKAAMNLGRTIKAFRAIKSLQETIYKVYHGTNEKFGKFNFNKATQGIIWFTDSIDSIQKGEHGGQGNKYIMTRYITINNPAGWDEYEKYGLQQLRDMGYDGVILPQDDKTDYFVFSNKNISAKPINENNNNNYLNDNFWKWFGNSKVVNPDGSPMVVYHGTSGDFGEFDKKKIGTQNDYGFMGAGFYFMADTEWGSGYAEYAGETSGGNPNIMPVYLKIENPFRIHDYKELPLRDEYYGQDKDKAIAITNELKKQGYDGVILDNYEFLAFEPTQIKSAIGNSGEFNPNNPDITKESVDDYRGEHTAPTKEDSPMYDVTNAYGEDIYGNIEKAVKYFGAHRPYDMYSIALIQRARNKPNMPVKIYRAVPATLTNREKINNYEKQKAYIQKTGRLPQGVDNWKDKSEYYDYISDEIEKLKALPVEQETKTKINSGDWVTINPAYAKEHGKSNLNNKYKVLTKTVSAKNLFTDGNDIHEWGYVE